ncbi:MAG: hypothetical protein IJC07_03560 [Clostridia bacterium]|nr:hypothetical protein [Clostridia bacterium]
MKAVIDHEKIGEIAYFEKFWTGKKELFINREPFFKVRKRTYEGQVDGKTVTAELVGGFFSGTTLKVQEETVQLTPTLKWYEIGFSLLLIALTALFAYIPVLNAIIPLARKILSIAVSVGLAIFDVALMKFTRSILLKIAITLLMIAFSFGFCLLLNL